MQLTTKMQNKLAPIGLSVYSRLGHLKQTIDALRQNLLAKESELFIFSDAPKPGDEEKVEAVRSYLKNISGFKVVHIMERTKNDRVANNRGGMRYLLDRYGKMIFLEEDVIAAPGFLTFVNNALYYYRDNNKVMSISGYAPPLKSLGKNKKDYFTLYRFNAWGVGFWKRSLDIMPSNLAEIDLEIIRPKLSRGGADIYHMALNDKNGQIDALDVKMMVVMAIYKMVSVYPKYSLVQNIGHDGSGIHCGETDKFNHKKLWDKEDNFVFSPDVNPDIILEKENFKFRSISIPRIILNKLKSRFLL